MLSRFLLGCLLATAHVVMGCSPNTEESAKVEGATDATPTATSGVNRPIQPAPDLDLADKGSVGAPTSGGQRLTWVWAHLKCPSRLMGSPKPVLSRRAPRPSSLILCAFHLWPAAFKIESARRHSCASRT